jgi:hypothetical protein
MKNFTLLLTKNETEIKESDIYRKINIYASTIATLFGFIGNILITSIFIRKRFRTNPCHIYLLCSAINDNLFLFIHLFEDTLRTYKDVYSLFNDPFISMLDIIDKDIIACRIASYLRNVLRFISVYFVVAFTIHRLQVVSKPISSRFKRKKKAWKLCLIIITIGMCSNIWIPFLFKIVVNENQNKYCDIDHDYKNDYFILNSIYMIFIVFIPMIIIFISNSMIIFILNKNSRKRNELIKLSNNSTVVNNCLFKRHKKQLGTNTLNISTQSNETCQIITKVKPHYKTFDQIINLKLNKINKQNNSYTTIMLLSVSFSFLILNLPYMICWLFYFNKLAFEDDIDPFRYFDFLQITEIFYVLNYGLKFYIFYATGSTFRKKLEILSNLILIIYFTF